MGSDADRERNKKERKKERKKNWKCISATFSSRNDTHIRIGCRGLEELEEVKEVAEKVLGIEIRVLKDQLFPIKADHVQSKTVLDIKGVVRLEVAKEFTLTHTHTLLGGGEALRV